jgi:hypothetical protein
MAVKGTECSNSGGGFKKSLAAAPGKPGAGAPRRLHSGAPVSLSALLLAAVTEVVDSNRRTALVVPAGHGHAWSSPLAMTTRGDRIIVPVGGEIRGGYEGGRR